MSREKKITAAEHLKLRQFLRQHGFEGVVGAGPGNRKKGQVAEDVKRYLRSLKKA